MRQVSACCRAGRWRQALEIVREMEQDAEVPPTVHTYTSVMKACGMAGQWRTTLQVAGDLPTPAPTALPRPPLPRRARAPRGSRPLPLHATPLTRAPPPLRTARQMLDRMQRRGLTPTAFHFGCAVDACGRGGEVRRARARARPAARDALSPGLPPISARPPAQVKRVLDLLREMQSRGLQPDVRTFTTALNACAKANQLNRALSIIERMYMQVTASPHLAAPRRTSPHLAASPRERPLSPSCHRMRGQGVQPDVATYNVLLQACERARKLDVITQLIQQARDLARSPPAISPDLARCPPRSRLISPQSRPISPGRCPCWASSRPSSTTTPPCARSAAAASSRASSR